METLHSLIDFTIEKRFQKTIQQMLDRHTSSLPPDEAPDLADSMGEMTDFHRDVLESPPLDEPPEEAGGADTGELAGLDETPSTLQDDTQHSDFSHDSPSQEELIEEASLEHGVHLTDAERAPEENVSDRITPAKTGEDSDEPA